MGVNMDSNPSVPRNSPLRFWCQKVLPLVYDDSLSYYELLNKMVVYLNNTITDVANCEYNVDALLQAFDALQNYVNQYGHALLFCKEDYFVTEQSVPFSCLYPRGNVGDYFIRDNGAIYQILSEHPSEQDTWVVQSTGQVLNYSAGYVSYSSNSEIYVSSPSNVDDALRGIETAIENGGGGSGLTSEIKSALLTCFENVAWIGDDGQDYYDALEVALYPPVNLVSISAVFNQGQNVIYDNDSLDTLRQYLTVTALYEDSTTTVITEYTLSGTLTTGTSTITVIYEDKTTTFNVIVTHATVQYTITNTLTNVTSSNNQTTINSGDAYAATLTAASGYDINTVTITMGGVDITSSAYDNGSISIASVTGNLAITAVGTEHVPVLESISAVYTQGASRVFNIDELDDLKPNLVVTANYDNSSHVTVYEYTLSGPLTAGESTITVTYSGKTTTFTVIVTDFAEISATVDFDQSGKLVDGSTGAVTNNSSWKATSLIEVPSGRDWLILYASASASFRGAWYDANEQYIRGMCNNSSSNTGTLIKDEIPANAKYYRWCTIASSGPDSVTVKYGYSWLYKGWSDTNSYYINDNGTISTGVTSVNKQYVTDYMPILSGTTKLYWGTKFGFNFKLCSLAVYNSNKEKLVVVRADGSTNFSGTSTTWSVDLSALTDPAYVIAGACDNSNPTVNNDPAAQIIYACQ